MSFRLNPISHLPELITDPVFIVGNGSSRENFDLNLLKGKGTIIGCNALYREFNPDILTVMNFSMMDEVFDYAQNNFCITLARSTHTINRIKQWKVSGVSSSGGLAIKLVSLLIQPSKCYMLGMDGDDGNIYNNTKNYSIRGNLGRMLKHNADAVKESKITKFINVNLVDNWPEDTAEFMTYEKFNALVVELVDTLVLGTSVARRESSSLS